MGDAEGELRPLAGSRKSARIRLRGKQADTKSTTNDEAAVSEDPNPQVRYM